MPAECRVYLTLQEAESGTTRMVRPAGGHWVEVSIPPTRHKALLRVATEHGDVLVRVTVVQSGLSASNTPAAPDRWRTPSWIGLALLAALIGVVVALLILRGCAATP